MPQQTLFGGWGITDLTIRMHLNMNKPGGRIYVEFGDENGKMAGSRSIQWTKDRDTSGLDLVAQEVVNAWLWAPQTEGLETLRKAFSKHCPKVPVGR